MGVTDSGIGLCAKLLRAIDQGIRRHRLKYCEAEVPTSVAAIAQCCELGLPSLLDATASRFVLLQRCYRVDGAPLPNWADIGAA